MQNTEFDQITVEQAARSLAGATCLVTNSAPEQKWWSFKVFGLTIYCYNFEWRRRALFCHDLHHVVTGFPFTLRGECQVAAWEFSAGRYPNVFANLFCLPLLLLGMLIIPSRTLQAFLSGQKARTLFSKELGPDVGSWPLKKLKSLAVSNRAPPARAIQILKFCGWLSASIALTLGVPVLVCSAVMQLV